MKLLFVGGEADGKWLEVYENERWVVPMKSEALEGKSRIGVHGYTRTGLHGGGEDCILMVLDGMDSNDLIRELIVNYRRGEP